MDLRHHHLCVHVCRLYGPALVANPNTEGVRDGGLSEAQSHVAVMNQVFKKYNTGIQFTIQVRVCKQVLGAVTTADDTMRG
jgi:hypothetical protein